MSIQSVERDEALIDRSFNMYGHLLGELDGTHPQHQGLTNDEFIRAIENPSVIKTTIESEGEKYSLPQLAPVSAFEWLHEPYFKNHFPEQMAENKVLHFTSFKNVEPSTEVKDKLRELAQKGGELIIDYRAADDSYPDDVKNFLTSIGIESEAEQLLGTQTYFEGLVEFKRPHLKRPTHLTYAEAFADKVAAGEVSDVDYKDGTTLEMIVEGHEADVLESFYTDAYATISDHPCTQALNPEEFREMLENPEIAKIVTRRNGVAQSLCLLTENLESLTWVNTDYYKKRHPEKYLNHQIIWFPGIATDPNPEVTGKNVPEIVGLLADLTERADNDPVVVFDLPDINTGFLDVYLEDSISKTPQLNLPIKSIAAQRYSAFKLKPNQ